MFARFKDEENIKAVERLLNSHTELEMFERSQLGEWSSIPGVWEILRTTGDEWAGSVGVIY